MPALMSLLRFPARGRVARLLAPRDSSAVVGRTFEARCLSGLRSFHLAMRLRSFVTSHLSPTMLPPPRKPLGLAIHADVVDSRLDEAVGAMVRRLDQDAHALTGE